MRFFHQGKEYIFIHISRTAGSYLEDNICQRYGIQLLPWPEPNLENLFGLYKLKDNQYITLQHLTYQELTKFFPAQTEDPIIFSIVRNPFDRLLSLYELWGGDQQYENLDGFLDMIMDFEMEKYQHNCIVTSNPNLNHLNMTQNPKECMYHFNPQYIYLTKEDGQLIERIFKMDNLKKLNPILDLNVSFNKPWPRKNIRELTKAQKNKIVQIYQKDFELLDYSTEYNLHSLY
jgi:hypothetical protein